MFSWRLETIEEAKIDRGRGLGKEREIHPVPEPGSAERIGIAEPGSNLSHKSAELYPIESALAITNWSTEHGRANVAFVSVSLR